MAEHSDVYKYKHGACIVKKGKILSMGFNQYKTHPLQKKYDVNRVFYEYVTNNTHYIHAEIKALTKLKNMDLSDCEIYVYRLGCNGKHAISRPCAACMSAIINSGIKKIIYTTDTGYVVEHINSDVMKEVLMNTIEKPQKTNVKSKLKK